MPHDTFTEVTGRGWASRLGGSVKGILFGLVLIGAGVIVLFWNEGRAVKRARDLEAGAGALVQVTADRVEPQHEGALVHFSGDAVTDELLDDPEFDVSVKALRLHRAVEMYQWDEQSDSETRRKVGGGTETTTTYSYHQTWSDRPIDSGGFKEPAGHENPDDMLFASRTEDARHTTVGDFDLPVTLVSRLHDFQPVAPPAAAGAAQRVQGSTLYVSAVPRQAPDPARPRVGDLRITWSAVEPGLVSVIGVQHGKTVEPWTGPSGSRVYEIRAGEHGGEAMFGRLAETNRIMTWILRAAGALALLVAFNMIFAPLAVLADVLPPVGTIVRLGTGTVSFLLASVIALTTIGLGWLLYRPLIGMPLLVVAAVALVALVVMLKSTRAAPPAEAEAEQRRAA